MFYEYNRTIFGWEIGAEALQMEELWKLLKFLNLDNSKVYEDYPVSAFEFDAAGRFIKVGDRYHPSSEGEPNEFVFYAPVRVGEKQLYFDSRANPGLKRDATQGGNFLEWSEYMEKMANLLNLVCRFLPPFMMICPGAKIVLYPNESKADVAVTGEFVPKAKFEDYKSYAGWMKNLNGNELCGRCGTEGDLMTMCGCWLDDDWSMMSCGII
eukprot:Seg13.11 transcript_id=Seg13.11/GoldUCD/mRNA.D3Y31 product="hypothetical protein" protein_id=Seg13.11/GoldUCD/D3Y31